MAESADALRAKLGSLATEETFLNAYTRRRAGDTYDHELITFAIANETYGIAIGSMREIIKPPPITEVPRTPKFVLGVVTVRGVVIPTIDLRARLGMNRCEMTRTSRVLIVDVRDEPHALVVDRVSSVVRFKDAEIEPPPAMGGGPETDFIQGIGRVDGELVILLDLPAVVTFALDSTS